MTASDMLGLHMQGIALVSFGRVIPPAFPAGQQRRKLPAVCTWGWLSLVWKSFVDVVLCASSLLSAVIYHSEDSFLRVLCHTAVHAAGYGDGFHGL